MKKLNIILFLAVFGMFGCTADSAFNEAGKITRTRSVVDESNRTNPYRLSVVQAALDDVCDEKGVESVTLTPTDYYVCFKPQDSLQMSKIRNLDVMLFNYPLDVAMTEEKLSEYSTANSDNICFYAVVPADMVLPDPADVCYEILDEAYIQKESNARMAKQLSDELYNQVLARTLEVTGNMPKGTRALAYWSPSARIRFREDVPVLKDKNIVNPLKGVMVSVTDFYNIGSALTNSSGETGPIAGNFVNQVVYSIRWGSEKWVCSENDVSVGSIPMIFIGETKKDKWDYTFENLTSNKSKETCAAAAHKALYEYYYTSDASLANLAKYQTVNPLEVEFIFRYNPETAGMYNQGVVSLYPVKQSLNYQDKYQITQTVFHQLGIASLDALNDYRYFVKEKGVTEGWAAFIEDLYMESVYPGSVSKQNNYTGISVSEVIPTSTGIAKSLYCNGMTPAQIENSLLGVSTWAGWKQSVKSKNLLKADNLDLIFEYPNTFLADIDNLIIVPEEVLYLDEGFTAKLSPGVARTGKTASVEYWSCTYASSYGNPQSCWFDFRTPGAKEVSASIKLPNNKSIVFRQNIYVMDRRLTKTQFPPYNYETTYKVYYNLPAGSTPSIQIDHLRTYEYNDIPYTHDPVEKSFSFKFPDGIWIDYRITMLSSNGTAYIFFSNIKEAWEY